MGSELRSHLTDINKYLLCETPKEWLNYALENQQILLIDHAHCEKKAASTALSLMYRYVDRSELLHKMAQLAREELLHFEQVLQILESRQINYCHLTPSRYATGLRDHIRTHEPARLVDTLITGALVEARSCERFAALAPLLDEELNRFYTSLLRSESRHFLDYLALANEYADTDISDRINMFAEIEKDLILKEDNQFRFHSGVPTGLANSPN